MRRIFTYLPVFALAMVLVSGCATDDEAQAGELTGVSSQETPAEVAGLFDDNRLIPSEVTPEIQADMDKATPADGDEVVIFNTSEGEIVIMMYGLVAPKTVANFKNLVNEGFYDGTRFHRCIPGFMIQGGDPTSKDINMSSRWGSGGPGYNIPDELNPITHERGVLSMAHAGANTGGSQFFIMDGVADHLNYVHTAFGRVLSGQDVAGVIIQTGAGGSVLPNRAAVIESAKVVTWPIN